MAANNEEWELDQAEVEAEQEPDPITYEISYYPADFTLKGYLDKDRAGQLVIPEFQRNYVWDQAKASKLIESFLLGLPVPGVFLYKERNTNKLLVIDGQQRIMSAIQFFRGAFEDTVFRLKKIDSRWNGKTYEELDEADRFQLDDAVLRATVIQQLDPHDDSSVYQIFERLNTGGVNLNPMEVRKCVYFGEFFRTLEQLNLLPEWRQLIGKPLPDKRLRDTELLLRVIALGNDWEDYEKPMKGFLNKFMISVNRHPEADQRNRISEISENLRIALKAVHESLPDRAFHLRGRLNFALLDSFLGVCIENVDRLNELDLGEKFAELKENPELIDAVTISTSDERVLKKRFQVTREKLREG